MDPLKYMQDKKSVLWIPETDGAFVAVLNQDLDILFSRRRIPGYLLNTIAIGYLILPSFIIIPVCV